MLSSELKAKCIKLDAKEREFKKWQRPATLLGTSVFVVLVAYSFLIPEGSIFSDYPTESFLIGIYCIPAVIITIFLLQKSKKYKIIGFSKNVVLTYRAYNSLEAYLKDGLVSHLDDAESKMDSLLTNLQTFWGNIDDTNVPFKSLEALRQNTQAH